MLTDDANGDALFVDDIYTALGGQARFSRISKILAGDGNDVVDMICNKFVRWSFKVQQFFLNSIPRLPFLTICRIHNKFMFNHFPSFHDSRNLQNRSKFRIKEHRIEIDLYDPSFLSKRAYHFISQISRVRRKSPATRMSCNYWIL